MTKNRVCANSAALPNEVVKEKTFYAYKLTSALEVVSHLLLDCSAEDWQDRTAQATIVAELAEDYARCLERQEGRD